MSRLSPKIAAASLSVATATALAGIKLVTALMTGSMAVLSSAVDSILDILMSGVNFMAIRQAEQPADESHPFGHGKYETLATLIQALVIAASGSWIIYESIRRLYQGVELVKIGGGVAVLLVSTLVSLLISRRLMRVGKATDSSALQADSLHFSMDVYTNLALVGGLLLVRLFNVPWFDPVLSLFVGAYILYEALRLVRRGMGDILDEQLPEAVRAEVEQLIKTNSDILVDFHKLRTRRAGSQKIMDFHLTVCKHLTIKEAHDIADRLEKKIEADIPGSDVIIHIEPCLKPECPSRKECREKFPNLKTP